MNFMAKLARDVVVVGTGMTRFHHKIHKNKTGRELFTEAVIDAVNSVDKGISLKDVEALFIGYFTPELYEHQGHIGPLMADWLGVCPIPTFRTEMACASSGAALVAGILSIASGMYDIVLVGGVEKMSNLTKAEVTDALSLAADSNYEVPMGVTFPGLYALIAQAHFKKYGTTWEQLQAVSIKNHHNGSLNPKAQFQEEVIDVAKRIGVRNSITFKDAMDFLRSPFNRMIAYPLRLFDCCPISDGASAVLLVAEEIAKKFTDTPIHIAGFGMASDNLALHDRSDFTTLRASVEAVRQAYRMADVKPKDIDVADVHDCFTIAEIVATEDLGFFKKGDGGKAIVEGRTALDGDIPINTDGGLKCKGHPVGATGTGMVNEIWKQLRGEAERRQIKEAETGLIHNVGGSGASAVVAILRR